MRDGLAAGRTLTLALASLFFAAFCSKLIAAEDVDAVLDKAEQALGGHELLADFGAIRFRSHGLWEMPARGVPKTPFETELVFCRPDHVRLLWKFPEEFGGVIQFGHDGKDAWGIFGGPPARCTGWLREVVLQLAAEPQLYLIAPARAEHGDAFALDVGGTAENPELVKVVYRPFTERKPWNVWFDNDTGHLVKLEHDSYWLDGNPILFRSNRSRLKNFAGLNYPSRAKFESLRDGELVEAGDETIDSIELNPTLPADFFACPKWEVDAATIATKDVGEEALVKFVNRGPYTEMTKSIDRMMHVVLEAGLVEVGSVYGTYLNDPNDVDPSDLLTEIAVRVAKVKEGEPTLPSGYAFTTLPAMRVACAYHRGDYASEGEAHQRLQVWMTEQGLHPAGPPRAVWFHDPKVTVTEDLVTEVQFPILESP
jgi:effector-binding domain-containing protein